jgi:hypothetical protein
VADLKAAGLTVTDALTQQKTITLAPHFGCTPDGIVTGHPEAPRTRHSLEIKTHSLKSFTTLDKDGVEKAHPKHWAQMQCEMKAQNTDRALYIAVCKDDDRIYTERVKVDYEAQEAIVERAKRIISSDRMPEPCSGASPSWYVCKMCAASDLCHGSKTTDQVNCRTCTFSTAEQDGTWSCARFGCEIPLENQSGCEAHVFHMDLVPWKLDTESSTEEVAVWIIDGKRIENGEPDANVFGSTELVANLQACLNRDELSQALREEFHAKVIG